MCEKHRVRAQHNRSYNKQQTHITKLPNWLTSISCLTDSLTHRFPEPPTTLAPRQVGPACFLPQSRSELLAGWGSIGAACNSQGHNDTEEIKVIPMKGLGKQSIIGCQSWEG